MGFGIFYDFSEHVLNDFLGLFEAPISGSLRIRATPTWRFLLLCFALPKEPWLGTKFFHRATFHRPMFRRPAENKFLIYQQIYWSHFRRFEWTENYARGDPINLNLSEADRTKLKEEAIVVVVGARVHKNWMANFENYPKHGV
ncbi:hypothetical protein B9Z55_009006 [Caenorhabditis nigoni]|uniref:DUF7040 domain-containing protein n=1 Tax=Caenorhabditis nigoni TaxID=1611254 RepID=A0A2G5UQL8_9PELO|nr:hypothetical protein B9Z55_009006 [Caenorhabditis nigoni]